MSGLVAVAAREIEERRAWLGTSVAFGLLQCGLPFVAALDVPTRDAIAAGLALAVPLAVAVALGSTIIATDIGERRLGFYFSRPLSGFSIWGGKILGAIVLTALTVALVAGPVVLANADLPGGVHTAAFVAPLFLIFLAHVVASALRSRSRLLSGDFVVPAVLAGAAAVSVQELLAAGAHATLFAAGPWVVAALIASFLLAGLAQVVHGRSDALRGHAVMSLVLWLALGLGTLGFAGFARWVLAVTPAEVGFVPWGMELAPRGETFRLGAGFSFGGQGRARFAPSFWMNAATGAWARDRPRAWHGFSGDGRRVLWLEEAPLRLMRATTDSMPPKGSGVELVGDPGWLIAVSPDGDRVVTQQNEQLHVLETATGRLVGSTRIGYSPSVAFLRGGVLRLFDEAQGGPVALRVVDWQPQTGELKALLSSMDHLHAMAGEGGRVIVSDSTETAFQVLEPSSGGAFPLPSGTAEATFLASGSVAALGTADGAVWVTEVASGGEVGQKIALPAFDPRGARIKESAPGVVSVAASPSRGHIWVPPDPKLGSLPAGRGVYVVDLAAARVLRHEADLRFAAESFGRPSTPYVGSLGARLMADDCGALLTADPLTGARRALLPCAQRTWFLP